MHVKKKNIKKLEMSLCTKYLKPSKIALEIKQTKTVYIQFCLTDWTSEIVGNHEKSWISLSAKS